MESASTAGSGTFDAGGPDMELVDELLARKEDDAVIRFLGRCRRFWPQGVRWSTVGYLRSPADPDQTSVQAFEHGVSTHRISG
jgi:hypothetical protein